LLTGLASGWGTGGDAGVLALALDLTLEGSLGDRAGCPPSSSRGSTESCRTTV